VEWHFRFPRKRLMWLFVSSKKGASPVWGATKEATVASLKEHIERRKRE